MPDAPQAVRLPPWMTGEPMPRWIEVDTANPWRWRLVTGRVANSEADETIDLSELLTGGDPSAAGVDGRALMVTAAWSMWVLATEGHYRRPNGASSVKHHFGLLRRVTGWMRAKGHARWDGLSVSDVDELKEWLYQLDRSKPPLGPSTREHVLRGLTATYLFRERGSMPDGLAIDPRINDETCVRRVIQRHRLAHPDYVDKRKGSTKSIPWAVAQDLLGVAIELVEHPLAATIVTMAAALHGRRATVDTRKPGALTLAHEKLYRLWRKDDGERAIVEAFALGNTLDFKELFRDLVTACWIVIALFAALRLEEAASLPLDTAVEQLNDGYWLVGVVRKTSPELAGSVVPLPIPPLVRRAVDLAASATAHHRGKRKQLLIFTHAHRNEIVLNAGFGAKCIRRFARRRCRTPAAKTFRYASHQLRKLYVQLFVRRFDGRVEDAQQHLRHVTAAMIDAYTGDPELLRLIWEEQKVFASEVMLAVMHGTEQAVGNPAGRWRADAARHGARTMTTRQAARFVERSGLVLHPIGIGFCVGGNQAATVAACGAGSDGLPDRAQASVVTCLGCVNGLSLARHLSLLKASYVIHKQVIDCKDAAGPLRVASERACAMLARRIEGLAVEEPANA